MTEKIEEGPFTLATVGAKHLAKGGAKLAVKGIKAAGTATGVGQRLVGAKEGEIAYRNWMKALNRAWGSYAGATKADMSLPHLIRFAVSQFGVPYEHLAIMMRDAGIYPQKDQNQPDVKQSAPQADSNTQAPGVAPQVQKAAPAASQAQAAASSDPSSQSKTPRRRFTSTNAQWDAANPATDMKALQKQIRANFRAPQFDRKQTLQMVKQLLKQANQHGSGSKEKIGALNFLRDLASKGNNAMKLPDLNNPRLYKESIAPAFAVHLIENQIVAPAAINEAFDVFMEAWWNDNLRTKFFAMLAKDFLADPVVRSLSFKYMPLSKEYNEALRNVRPYRATTNDRMAYSNMGASYNNQRPQAPAQAQAPAQPQARQAAPQPEAQTNSFEDTLANLGVDPQVVEDLSQEIANLTPEEALTVIQTKYQKIAPQVLTALWKMPRK